VPTPEIVLPGGFTAPTGLILPTDLPPMPGRIDLPSELRVEPTLVVAGRVPAFIDQVWVFATQEELGLPATPRDALLRGTQDIPFWPAMKLLARFQRDLWPVRTIPEGQLELARRFYGADGGFAAAAAAFLSGGERHVLFSEQQLFTLQKLLLIYAADSDVDQELTGDEYTALLIALAAIPGTLLGPQVAELEEADADGISDETWLRFFVGHGGFIGRGNLKHEVARTRLLYEELAESADVHDHQDYCAIAEWVDETLGISFSEQLAAGFALWAGSHTGDVETTPVLVDESYFDSTGLAGDKAVRALQSMSEERDWYREKFLQSADDERRLAFEITPFLQRPALRFPDGRMMPFAPRALEGWMGATGAYYRFFDLAIGKGSAVRERFTRFNGLLVEKHVLGAAQALHPAVESLVWVPRAIGESVVETGAGEIRTPDVVIDYGTDLILIEITSGRPTILSVVDADPEAIRADIEKLLEAKITQLGDRIRDLVDGTITLPGIDLGSVERIWPIVVNSEGLFLTPVLWSYLRDQTPALTNLDQPRVQPLTLFDLEDVERFFGLGAAGNSLIEILRSKTTPAWREREFASWYDYEGAAFPTGAFSYIDDATERAFQGMIKTLLGEQTLEEYQRRISETRESGNSG
jgi:hypothetical protein